MHLRTAFVLIAAATSALATGCSSTDSKPAAGETRASLHRAQGCGDLLSDLRADASWKINQGIDLQIASIRKCIDVLGDVQECAYYGGYGGGGPVYNGAPEGDAKASGSTTGGAPVPSSAPSDSASSYSETNTQVKGVDEADIIKNDGKNLYVLHGNAFKVINAWPASDLREISSTDVEGNPQEMFVADGKVVIYSQVNGASIFTAAGVTPHDTYQDYVYYPMGGGGGAMIASDARPAPAPYPGGGTSEPYYPLTKMTVMSLDGAGKTQVTREIYFEGGYLDARRVGQHVRTVLEGSAHGPKLRYGIYDYQTDVAYTPPETGSQMIAALEELRRDNLSAIENSKLSDWLPYTFVKDGAAVKAHNVACEDFYIPSIGSTESGMTEVASLDLSDAAAQPKETAILGAADTVYGGEDTLYLASRAWVEPPVVWMDGTGYAVTSTGTVSAGSTGGGGVSTKTVGPASPPGTIISWSTNKTHLHKFDFTADPTFPNYQASGTVVGNVKDQFSLDDKDGYLRVATTESRAYVEETGKYVPFDSSRPNTANHVFTLKQNGPWLDTQGDVGDLATNEQIRSVRFLGNRGYVVTFRQVDPLFVVDLTNQAKPNVLAALKIPGFSEYMHPLDENHLLTIGRDGTTTGQTNGLALQIFDVTDGASPKLMQKFAYSGTQYGGSEAEYDHKAFTYFADKSLLAFPYYSNGYDATTGTYSAHSTLEVFKVDVASGFAYLGAMDHSAFIQKTPTGYCGGYYAPSVRRGVFLENYAYSISYGGIVSKDVNALGGAGTAFALEAPVVNTGYGPACY